VFKNYPLEKVHRWAKKAAEAAECAGMQGKFWEFHDLLFEHQAVWAKSLNAPEFFSSYGEEIGLNLSEYTTCLEDPAISLSIQRDKYDGEGRAVRSTPTFFINEKRYVGPRQFYTVGFEEIRRLLGS